MLNRIFLLIICCSTFLGCKKFLDKTPSEGGLVGFSNVEQFDALLNEIRLTRNRYEWNHAIYASDDCYFSPDFQTANASTYQQREAFNIWNENESKNLAQTSTGFGSSYAYMYTLNYITDRIDDDNITGSMVKKKQLKGEAMFIRAFYHSLLAVQYLMHPALNNGNYPGLNYRNTTSTDASTYSDRLTVKFTIDKMFEDLTNAEQLLTEAGRNDWNQAEPWRVTLPTVYALRARMELYVGNYENAFKYAQKAYAANNFVYDMNDASLFAMVNRGAVQTETVNGVTYSVYAQSPVICANATNTSTQSNSLYFWKEAYFRSVCQTGAAQKLPPSAALYDLFDANDLRKKIWLDNNQNINNSTLFKASRKDELVSKSYMKYATGITASGYILGPTVPEMMLIMAECRARGKGDGQDASVIMKELRKKRFPAGYADNITGTLASVKDERRRELAFVMRWFDLKRYNALDSDNITVRKLNRRDVYSLGSPNATWTLAPNAPAYALPMPQAELTLLGWPQNEYGGVSAQ